jgi:hypothetical protein
VTSIDAVTALPNNPKMLKAVLCIWVNEARGNLDKARDLTVKAINLGKQNT